MSALLNELERLRAKNVTMLAALREALPVVEKLQELIAKHHPGFELRQTAIVRDAIASAEGGAQSAPQPTVRHLPADDTEGGARE